nr:MAG TPA: hypothetical protein [Caudoviricetes sp.]
MKAASSVMKLGSAAFAQNFTGAVSLAPLM